MSIQHREKQHFCLCLTAFIEMSWNIHLNRWWDHFAKSFWSFPEFCHKTLSPPLFEASFARTCIRMLDTVLLHRGSFTLCFHCRAPNRSAPVLFSSCCHSWRRKWWVLLVIKHTSSSLFQPTDHTHTRPGLLPVRTTHNASQGLHVVNSAGQKRVVNWAE